MELKFVDAIFPANIPFKFIFSKMMPSILVRSCDCDLVRFGGTFIMELSHIDFHRILLLTGYSERIVISLRFGAKTLDGASYA